MITYIGNGIPVFGQHDEGTQDQMVDVASRAVKAALMADGHKGYVMPIGGVAAYNNKVSVVGVGYDIGCGNCAILTDLTIEDISGDKISLRNDGTVNPSKILKNKYLIELANEIESQISFGLKRGMHNRADDAPSEHSLFHDDAMWIIPNDGGYRDLLIYKAREQLGTVGGGNHYVDVFYDNQGRIWVGVHFGSRGFGHTIAKNFIALSQGGDWGDRKIKEQEVLLDLDSQIGQDYWALMELAGRYAYAGREWATRKVTQIMGGQEVEMVHNHHNFAWKEEHDGQELIVVRKGSTPAYPGQRGFVGGSMGDDSVILEGTYQNKLGYSEVDQMQEDALYSTVHGAGRIMSRTAAKGKWNRSGTVQKKRGMVSHSMMKDWLDKKGVIRRGGDLDESPHAYRRLDEVLKMQGNTITVLETLHPLIVCMAPPDVKDPYKD